MLKNWEVAVQISQADYKIVATIEQAFKFNHIIGTFWAILADEIGVVNLIRLSILNVKN